MFFIIIIVFDPSDAGRVGLCVKLRQLNFGRTQRALCALSPLFLKASRSEHHASGANDPDSIEFAGDSKWSQVREASSVLLRSLLQRISMTVYIVL